MLPYKEKVFSDVIRLRILTLQDYPKLSIWALNPITSDLRETKGDYIHIREHGVKMETEMK